MDSGQSDSIFRFLGTFTCWLMNQQLRLFGVIEKSALALVSSHFCKLVVSLTTLTNNFSQKKLKGLLLCYDVVMLSCTSSVNLSDCKYLLCRVSCNNLLWCFLTKMQHWREKRLPLGLNRKQMMQITWIWCNFHWIWYSSAILKGSIFLTFKMHK